MNFYIKAILLFPIWLVASFIIILPIQAVIGMFIFWYPKKWWELGFNLTGIEEFEPGSKKKWEEETDKAIENIKLTWDK